MVFGAADLTKNWSTRFNRGGKLYDSNSLPFVAYVGNERTRISLDLPIIKTNSFCCGFGIQGEQEIFFKEIKNKKITHTFDPLKEPDLSATGRNFTGVWRGLVVLKLGSKQTYLFAEGAVLPRYIQGVIYLGGYSFRGVDIPGV